ncbi:MAG TPA: flagellar hook protein FlgE [Propylenella sp.]|nr:flagellar hook protein FlgE [Propylenella sp.]
MSLYGVMRTSVSGMNALSNKLSTVGDNIANSGTVGYKQASTEFSSLVLSSGQTNYESGGVNTTIRYGVTQQGSFQYTASVTDLAISGSGFFIVSDEAGTPYLTRAGSFVPDGEGNLVNAAGYYLMGYPLTEGEPGVVANGLSGLQVVNIAQTSLAATPSTSGDFSANLPSTASSIAAADLPSGNAATATYTAKTSLVAYDNLGQEVLLDVYFSKTGENTWEVTAFDSADAAPAGGFPYVGAPLTTATLDFDPATGNLTNTSASALSISIPNGAVLTLDLAGMTQLATDYTILDAEVNGNAPSALDRVEIGDDGTVYSVFENGSRMASYTIPLADVPSPDNLTPISGNVYQPSAGSGDVQVGFSGLRGYGTIVSGALEGSTVDLATELTAMIEAQRGYTANSKVFQTASDLLDVLVNLKR